MDLTKLMKGPAEAEPVQEQPKLSEGRIRSAEKKQSARNCGRGSTP